MSNFQEKPTNEYMKTNKSLESLLLKEGLDSVTRAYADSISKFALDSFISGFHVKKATGKLCIQKLNNKKCKGELENQKCECRPPHDDHPSLWIREEKPTYYISQPYSLNLDYIKDIVEFCERYNLKVSILTHPSWHFPGRVLTLVYTSKEYNKGIF